ncbi:uncharacterized protein KY384_002301 [Bacidia gigantensis]|uniref:uncharacterized protein n=1 Tax=Bacidia gigantensis TaxID=2732470 RepID=UPI001D0444DD|nr:uncharacterized protein KY384_002301 [Bacidia gigantensis]KAG8533515.1 hypothetical protein KY384_002301 [Bacidia gigantensis]
MAGAVRATVVELAHRGSAFVRLDGRGREVAAVVVGAVVVEVAVVVVGAAVVVEDFARAVQPVDAVADEAVVAGAVAAVGAVDVVGFLAVLDAVGAVDAAIAGAVGAVDAAGVAAAADVAVAGAVDAAGVVAAVDGAVAGAVDSAGVGGAVIAVDVEEADDAVAAVAAEDPVTAGVADVVGAVDAVLAGAVDVGIAEVGGVVVAVDAEIVLEVVGAVVSDAAGFDVAGSDVVTSGAVGAGVAARSDSAAGAADAVAAVIVVERALDLALELILAVICWGWLDVAHCHQNHLAQEEEAPGVDLPHGQPYFVPPHLRERGVRDMILDDCLPATTVSRFRLDFGGQHRFVGVIVPGSGSWKLLDSKHCHVYRLLQAQVSLEAGDCLIAGLGQDSLDP